MQNKPGIIALMGSGELTATMVEVHKLLLRRAGSDARAVFLDTPAGFQLNVDHIARKAHDYFQQRVQHPLQIASFKSAQALETTAAQETFHTLRQADYMLIGPGSPTYALEQLQSSPIPQLIIQRIEAGACLVAASAAALTVGRLTLPVYEIYKVGAHVHWLPGLNILGHFGLDWVVVPHWNNAEGGNHDTRFCFMGEQRLARLEALLPESTPILGLDEHTVLIINLNRRTATIQGIGQVTLRCNGREQVYTKADDIPLERFGTEVSSASPSVGGQTSPPGASRTKQTADTHWTTLHQLEAKIIELLNQQHAEQATQTLLDFERHIWNAREKIEEDGGMGAAREVLREILTLYGRHLSARPKSYEASIGPIVEALLELRETFRKQKMWDAADAIRTTLEKANVMVEDSPDGARWHIQN